MTSHTRIRSIAALSCLAACSSPTVDVPSPDVVEPPSQRAAAAEEATPSSGSASADAADAPATASDAPRPPDSEDAHTVVVPLQHAAADVVEAALRDVVGSDPLAAGVRFDVHRPTNSLVLHGGRSQIEHVQHLVRALDV